MELKEFIKYTLISIIESGATGPIEFDLAVTGATLNGQTEIVSVMNGASSRIKFTIEIDCYGKVQHWRHRPTI